MSVQIVNPSNGLPLRRDSSALVDETGARFEIVNEVPRFAPATNYAASFGLQWNLFASTQIDREADGFDLSRRRFFAETRWSPAELAGQDVLEVGSGAGRFSRVVLQYSTASLYSVDYSIAVDANRRNNIEIAADRLHLFQASVYTMPFPDNSFDKVFCFGVLQHTPDFEESVRVLICKAKRGAEVAVDFYPIKGWWTKLHAKYLLRPITKRLSHQTLLALIERHVDRLIVAHRLLHRVGLGVLARFVPVCDVTRSFPHDLPAATLRELVVLDTFDQYSPEHDHPQRIETVARMFERHGATVTFAGFESYGDGMSAAVVRATKR